MRNEEPDPIMDAVLATRRKISERYGYDPSLYISAVREKAAKAKSLGMSYVEYCLAELEYSTSPTLADVPCACESPD